MKKTPPDPSRRGGYPRGMAKQRVCWNVNVGAEVPTGREDDAWAWVLGTLDGFLHAIRVEEAPRRLVLEARFDDFPADAPGSRLEVALGPDPRSGLPHLRVLQEGYHKANGYEYLMRWTQVYFGRLRDHLKGRPAEAASPLSAGQREERLAWAGRQTSAEALVRGLKPWGRPALVRAALACAELSLPVWTRAATEGGRGYEDLASGFGTGTGQAPPAQIEAARRWLADPSPEAARAARLTVDLARQLRFVDEELRDPAGAPFALALEASYCCARAVAEDPEEEALVAVQAVSLLGLEPLPAILEALRTGA